MRFHFSFPLILAAVFGLAACSSATARKGQPLRTTSDDHNASVSAQPSAVTGAQTAAPGYVSLGFNNKGYQEFRRERDGATVVFVPEGYFVKRLYGYWPPDTEDGAQTWLDGFLMDKTEVTNAQVAAFIASRTDLVFKEDKLYGPDGMTPWAVTHQWGLCIKDGRALAQVGYECHPVVGTSGFLAIAYAQWVGGDLPRGYEYEKAAAGPTGQFYPWGDQTMMPDSARVNFYLSGPRHTMPVGSYPLGASPYGCLDMAGNVYERAYWGESAADIGARGNQPRMIKGGSWLSPHWWNLRCVCRCGQPLDAMDGSVGFRVIVRDKAVIEKLAPPKTRLRTLADTTDALTEAAARNVPIFLYLGYET